MRPSCSTDNDFARSFTQWLQSSCGGGKSQKQSDISVTRALKFLKFCCDETGDVEEDLLSAGNLIDYVLGSPEIVTKFVDSLKSKWGIGHSGRIAYVSAYPICWTFANSIGHRQQYFKISPSPRCM